jgi:hypothetical protein
MGILLELFDTEVEYHVKDNENIIFTLDNEVYYVEGWRMDELTEVVQDLDRYADNTVSLKGIEFEELDTSMSSMMITFGTIKNREQIKWDMTNLNNSIKVFSAVIGAVKMLLDRGPKPDTISYEAESMKRDRIYNKIITSSGGKHLTTLQSNGAGGYPFLTIYSI